MNTKRIFSDFLRTLILTFGIFVRLAIIVFSALSFGCLVCPIVVTMVVRLMGVPVSAGLDLKLLFWLVPTGGVLIILSVFLLRTLFLFDGYLCKFFDRLSCKVESMIEREVKK